MTGWKCGLAIAIPWVAFVAVLLVSRSCEMKWEAKDLERKEEIAVAVFRADAEGEKAAIAAADAEGHKARADAAEAEIEALKGHLQPVTNEVCRVPVARRDRIIRRQEEQINIHKATEDALWVMREHNLEEIKNLRTALELQGDRAEGWKKSAKRNRRDKILIGTFSAIGGAGVMALAVYGAGQL